MSGYFLGYSKNEFRQFLEIIPVNIFCGIFILSIIKISYILKFNSKLKKKTSKTIEGINHNLKKIQRSIFKDFKSNYDEGKVIKSEWKKYKKIDNNLYKYHLNMWIILASLSLLGFIIVGSTVIYLDESVKLFN